MLEEVRITGLGVIDDAVLELSRGFTVVTGETGAGKTMVVTGLGPAVRRPGRPGPGPARRGAGHGRGPAAGRRRTARWPSRSTEAGGDLDDDGGTLVLSRSVSAEGRSRAFAGGRSVPVSLLTYLADDLVAVHGQADQQQLLRPGPAAAGAGPVRRARAARRPGRLPARLPAAPRGPGRARRADRPGPRAGGRGRGPAPRAGRDRAGRAGRRRGHRAAAPRRSGWPTPTRCTRPRPPRTRRCSATRPAGRYEAADAVTLLAAARQALEAVADHDPALAGLARPAVRGRLPGLRRRRRAGLLRCSRSTPTRPGWPPCRSAAPS